MSLTIDDALFILSHLTSEDVLNNNLLSLQQYFSSLITERKLEDCLFNVCHLVSRMLYLNYGDFLSQTSEQIAALFFLFSVYERRNNPFLGFIFDVINIDAYRTISPKFNTRNVSRANRFQFHNIESEVSELSDEILNNFEELHRILMEELENHEANLNVNVSPISMNLYTVEDFPQLPVICKQVFYSLISGIYTPKILSLTPKLLSIKTGNVPIRSIFNQSCVLELIKKQELCEDWKIFKLSFCPIYVFENFFANRKNEQVELLRMILDDIENKSNEVSPEIVRLPPQFAPIQEQEFVFPYSSFLNSIELEWNDDILEEDENKDVKDLRNTLKKAFTTHFYPNQTQQILHRLRSYEQLVFEIDLDPERFMDLVENNPAIATEAIVIFVKNCFVGDLINFNKVGEYLMKIIDVDISVQSMEVINGLSSRIVLPTEFMHIFISHSIKSCDNIKDKTLQSRLARLNCVFLQSLITNKLVNVADILSEVQIFCVEFMNLREATVLYRLLRNEIHNNFEDKIELSE